MNPLDLAVIAVIVLSAIFAFARGFVREALSIVAWLGAAAITLYGFNALFALVDARVHEQLLSQVVAGVGLFVVSLVVLTIATGFLARLVRSSALSPIDRTLGFIFGLARGAFLVCLAYLLLDVSLPEQNARPIWIREARSAPYLHEGADVLRNFLPESLKLKTATAVEDTVKTLNPALEADKAMRALATPNPAPAPSAKPDSPAPPSYPSADRRDLDRLIRTQR